MKTRTDTPPRRTVYVEVLLNVPVDKTFFYKRGEVSPLGGVELPSAACAAESPPPHPPLPTALLTGRRAAVSFGGRRMTAFIVAEHDESGAEKLLAERGIGMDKILALGRLIDDEPVFTDAHIALARLMARYYLTTPGEALSAMIPSGRRDSRAAGFSLESDETEFEKKTLSEEQIRAVEAISVGRRTEDGGMSFPSPAFYPVTRRLSNPCAQSSILNPQSSTTHYLYGITGSGKTEVFLRAAEAALERGGGVLYLVPEIALTYQTVRAVGRRFGEKVAVLHSGLTPSQRIREWRRCLKKEARIVVGARSAVFAPIPDLALIIIDEEHDPSYKSGSSPRYHARQVAQHIARTLGIPLVMGSATPSVEAWYLMKTGAIRTHALTARLAGGGSPQVSVVDLSAEGTAGGSLSPALTREIEATLAEGRQVILFLNRRGFTHLFRCNSCGFEFTCKNCSVPLTFHKSENRLRCHYCGWTAAPPALCPECGSLDVGYHGFGTEYIESEARAKFPAARIERLDTDSVRGKAAEGGGLEETLEKFRRGDIDILLGTQMVAKGLNFPRLKLVGIVLADVGLSMPDFRSAERCFSLVTQVSGRAGRFFPDGKVIVQSFNPSRPAIALSCAARADEFYAAELEARKTLGFPPFSRLIRLVFRSANKEAAEKASAEAARWMRNREQGAGGRGQDEFPAAQSTPYAPPPIPYEVLGPAECPLAKVAANYRMQVLLRGKSLGAMRNLAGAYLSAVKTPAGVYVEIDVDPVSLL